MTTTCTPSLIPSTGRAAALRTRPSLSRVPKHLDLRVEVGARAQARVLLVDHHVARARHVVLLETLDVHADVVTRVRQVLALVVHLHREHLAAAGVRRRVRRQEDHLRGFEFLSLSATHL